ncbi:PREDICTED: calumenin-like [Amphimedon queenslandica]|uniref:Reticulocalbin-3 n=1 Tax=Amphimedon queenslandica TaxID=400682 RepID=A0A1X7V6G8_AMPQE|nr:PREDICTED: calumenin-like [Amphimedon queenslandica]|eukprot:XP_003385607.1 PREDICTED: calumenin-like [Amphimedon queenslandica]
MLKLLLVLSLLIIVVNGGPTKEGRRKRGPVDLSDEEHYDPKTNGHNVEYDHEAFLGKEEAEEMQHLSPEEQKRRLQVIFGKIDTNNDKHIEHNELKKWVESVAHRHVIDSTAEQMPEFDKNKDGKVTLEEYHSTAYGEVEDEDAEYDPHRKLSFKEMKARDKRRFDSADKDNDGSLNKEEFGTFLHPEDNDHMRDIVIDEAMEDMDKDKDGFIALQEYVDDIWPKNDRQEDESEPDWVKSEREQFSQHRDSNKDGKLDKRELGSWIAPDGHDNAEAEARHLIFNADKDKDGKLTMAEMLENEELFIGSQATDFGNILSRHDEF